MSESKQKKTTDHKAIRQWAESHNGQPAKIASTDTGKGEGLLRIHFKEQSKSDEDTFEQINWDEFFNVFEKNDLALLYQEQKADGQDSTFHKLVSR